jgi:hypothetical protein
LGLGSFCAGVRARGALEQIGTDWNSLAGIGARGTTGLPTLARCIGLARGRVGRRVWARHPEPGAWRGVKMGKGRVDRVHNSAQLCTDRVLGLGVRMMPPYLWGGGARVGWNFGAGVGFRADFAGNGVGFSGCTRCALRVAGAHRTGCGAWRGKGLRAKHSRRAGRDSGRRVLVGLAGSAPAWSLRSHFSLGRCRTRGTGWGWRGGRSRSGGRGCGVRGGPPGESGRLRRTRAAGSRTAASTRGGRRGTRGRDSTGGRHPASEATPHQAVALDQFDPVEDRPIL